MVFAFTEAEKAQIESRGMTVIEFKRELRRIEHANKAIFRALNKLLEVTEVLVKAIRSFCEKFYDMIDELKLAIEEAREEFGYSNSRRYKIVKILSKCTGIEKKSIWKITRHTYLARSYC